MLTAIRLPSDEKLQRNLAAYTSQCLEIGLATIKALVSLGESFTLLIFSDDTVSQQYVMLMEHFLKYQPTFGPVLSILVRSDGPSKRGRYLGVSRVPQLRRYVKGKEIRRLVGTADYDQLLTFFGGAR